MKNEETTLIFEQHEDGRWTRTMYQGKYTKRVPVPSAKAVFGQMYAWVDEVDMILISSGGETVILDMVDENDSQ